MLPPKTNNFSANQRVFVFDTWELALSSYAKRVSSTIRGNLTLYSEFSAGIGKEVALDYTFFIVVRKIGNVG